VVTERPFNTVHQRVQSTRGLDDVFGLRSVNLDVCLDVSRGVNSGLSGLVLQATPQHVGDRPWLGRCMFEDCSDRSLRQLSHQFLSDTRHFQQIVEDEFAHLIESGLKRNHEFGVQ
jgi:hypothetical protein